MIAAKISLLCSGQSKALQHQACSSPTIYFSPSFVVALSTEGPPGWQLKRPLPAEAWPTSLKGFLLPFSLARQVPLFLPGGPRWDLDSASNVSSFSAPICPHTPLHSAAAPSRAARCSSQARMHPSFRAASCLSHSCLLYLLSPATPSSPGAADVEERW